MKPVRDLRRGMFYAEITCPATVSVDAALETLESLGIRGGGVENNRTVLTEVEALVVPALYWRLPLGVTLVLRG